METSTLITTRVSYRTKGSELTALYFLGLSRWWPLVQGWQKDGNRQGKRKEKRQLPQGKKRYIYRSIFGRQLPPSVGQWRLPLQGSTLLFPQLSKIPWISASWQKWPWKICAKAANFAIVLQTIATRKWRLMTIPAELPQETRHFRVNPSITLRGKRGKDISWHHSANDEKKRYIHYLYIDLGALNVKITAKLGCFYLKTRCFFLQFRIIFVPLQVL